VLRPRQQGKLARGTKDVQAVFARGVYDARTYTSRRGLTCDPRRCLGCSGA